MTLAGRALASVVAASALWTAALAEQKNPYREYRYEKFVENMQAAGRSYTAVTKLAGGGDYESAKAQLTRAREQLAITITFWRDRKRNDAEKMLRNALGNMDNLDAVLGAVRVEAATVRAAMEQVDKACSACHAAYRDQDPVTKAYRLKPGSIP